MPKKKVSVNFSNNFFDEMEVKMQKEDNKRRKLNNDVDSQPELLFLQFKPNGKEDFTSFSNKSYCQPNTSSVNKKPWKPPIKGSNDPVTTELDLDLKNSKEGLTGHKRLHELNASKVLCIDSDNTKDECEEIQTTNLGNTSCSTSSGLSNTHKQITDPIADASGIQNEKHLSDFIKNCEVTKSECDKENMFDGCHTNFVKGVEVLPINIAVQRSNIQEINEDPPNKAQFSANESIMYDEQDLEGVVIPICNENYEEINDVPDQKCPTSQLNSKNSSFIGDELTEPNPWTIHSNSTNKHKDINNFRNFAQFSGSTVNNSSSDEELTLSNPWINKATQLQASLDASISKNCHKATDDYKNNVFSDMHVNKDVNNLQEFEQGVNSCPLKELYGNNNELIKSNPNYQYTEICSTDIVKCDDSYKEHDQLSQHTNKVLGNVICRDKIITNLDKCDQTFGKEGSHKNNTFSHQIREELRKEEINPKLEKSNSFKGAIGGNINKDISFSDFNRKENKEIDFYDDLTQSNIMCEGLMKENRVPDHVANTTRACSNIFQFDPSKKRELTFTEMQQFEPDNSNYVDYIKNQIKNKQCKLPETCVHAGNNVINEHRLETNLICSQNQTCAIRKKEVLKDSMLSNNSEIEGSEPLNDRYWGELSYNSNNDQNNLKESKEKQGSAKSSCQIPKYHLNDQTTEIQLEESVKTNANGDINTNKNPLENTDQPTPNEEKTKNTERNFQNENNTLDDSCLMISNSQLLEIEQKCYVAPESIGSEHTQNKKHKREYCKSVGTQTDLHHSPHPETAQLLSSHSQWAKAMQETKMKLRDVVQEVNRLNYILLKLRKDIWPQQI